jgi:hypothetical protein
MINTPSGQAGDSDELERGPRYGIRLSCPQQRADPIGIRLYIHKIQSLWAAIPTQVFISIFWDSGIILSGIYRDPRRVGGSSISG